MTIFLSIFQSYFAVRTLKNFNIESIPISKNLNIDKDGLIHYETVKNLQDLRF